MKIIIIFDKPGSGDISPDHADVLYQVQSVRDTLTALGHECSELGISLDLEWRKKAQDSQKCAIGTEISAPETFIYHRKYDQSQ